MKINKLTNIEVSTLANKERTYLYNEMMNLSRKYKLGGEFGNYYISLKGLSEEALKELKDKGIKFMRVG